MVTKTIAHMTRKDIDHDRRVDILSTYLSIFAHPSRCEMTHHPRPKISTISAFPKSLISLPLQSTQQIQLMCLSPLPLPHDSMIRRARPTPLPTRKCNVFSQRHILAIRIPQRLTNLRRMQPHNPPNLRRAIIHHRSPNLHGHRVMQLIRRRRHDVR